MTVNYIITFPFPLAIRVLSTVWAIEHRLIHSSDSTISHLINHFISDSLMKQYNTIFDYSFNEINDLYALFMKGYGSVKLSITVFYIT